MSRASAPARRPVAMPMVGIVRGLSPRGRVDRLRPGRRAPRRCRGGCGTAVSGARWPACSASSAWESGQVASECGKSFAHMRRRSFMRSTVLNATQSSWNVRYTCSRNVSLGRFGELAGGEPVAVPVVGVVGAVHPVRCPTGVGLDAHHAQVGMALEHRAEDQRADDVLVAADDREERVELRAADRAGVRRVGAAREDVERRREPELDDRVPELVVHRVVVVG